MTTVSSARHVLFVDTDLVVNTQLANDSYDSEEDDAVVGLPEYNPAMVYPHSPLPAQSPMVHSRSMINFGPNFGNGNYGPGPLVRTRQRSRTISRQENKRITATVPVSTKQSPRMTLPLLSRLRSRSMVGLQQLISPESTHPSDEQPTKRASTVYCHGPILRLVQEAHIFEDSKDFVDMPMKVDPEIILQEFHSWKEVTFPKGDPWTNPAVTLTEKHKLRLKEFINKYFLPPGCDLEPVDLPDYYPEPPVLQKIKNPNLRNWAREINRIWNTLGRRVTYGVFLNPQRHSLLPSKRLLVVPGGRFRETYYWDTYWMIEGLLSVGMLKTARGMVLNLCDYVERYGFIPNGGRVYYLDRSQPPLLSEMVRVIYEATEDRGFLQNCLVQLQNEYKFWMDPEQHRVVKVTLESPGKAPEEFLLNRYYSSLGTPRPESYREDIHTVNASEAKTASERHELYRNIRAGAETGWDFTSRWLRDKKTLETIDATHVLPVDLNAFLYKMELNLADFNMILGNEQESFYYKMQAAKRAIAIEKLLWVKDDHQWKDLWIDSNGRPTGHSTVVAASNWLPLWSKCHESTIEEVDVSDICKSLLASGLLGPGGVATTNLRTGQQWDYPNAWAPLQALLIEGLENSGDRLGKHLAFAIARTWVSAGYEAFEPHSEMFWKYGGSHMFEKYDMSSFGYGGGGGEYIPQTGFGWSNGVVLMLLNKYGDRLESGSLWSRVHRSAFVF